ncbi:MAG TPA: DUF2066 domain-containing protein [Stellaceae bacterium]|nr:DUF2066 domain-containing protein [Stellaceae bacterium]
MSSPLVSAIAGSRTGGRAVAARLLFVLALSLAAAGSGRALADQPSDPYSATVKVDATAASAVVARTIARTQGQRAALMKVINGLTGSTDDSQLPKLDDQAITDMVENFEVANEKMSTVRYLADYTFHFKRSAVRQLLRRAGIAFSDHPGEPVVVVPVFQDGTETTLWDDPNPWREAWSALPPQSGPTRFTVPFGGVADLTTIDAEQARAGDAQALTDIAQRNGGDVALVAIATTERQGDQLTGVALSLKRYRQGQLLDSRSDEVKANPGEDEAGLLQRTVALAVGDIEHGPPPPSPASAASLDAVVPISSLGDWVEMRQRLAAIPAIRGVDLLSLSRQQAKIEIRYVGNPDQLKSALADADLDLAGADPDWQLQPASAAEPH